MISNHNRDAKQNRSYVDGKNGRDLRWLGAPKYDKRMLVLHAFLITGIAFEFNYLWENIQCSPFFIYLDGTPTPIAMFVATIGGVAMTWFVHCVIAIVSGRWLWLLGRWRWPQWRLLLGTALVLSFLVEQWALATGRWTYTNINPRIPDTSISALPVAQLVLLFPLTFGLSRLLPRSLAKPGGRAKTYSRAS